MRARAEPTITPLRRRAFELSLLCVAALWGATFVTVKNAVEHVPVFEFLALRYALAAVILTALFWRQAVALGRQGLRAGFLAGAFLFSGYAAQTIGLQYTRASNAAFVTGLFVVIAPVLSSLLLRRRPSTGSIVGVALAVVGLALLSLKPGVGIPYGDAVVLGASFSFSFHIIVLARYSPEFSPAGLTVVQCWVAAIAAAILSLTTESVVAPTHPDVVWGVIITGLFASALGFSIQTFAQRYVSPTRTAVILVTEPAFAGLFGVALLGESLAVRGWIGAGMILAGMLVSELTPQRGAEG
jgi:drug/metabolite transporter (DMT)-like permease